MSNSEDAEDGGERPAKSEVLRHVHEAIDGSEYRIHAVIPSGSNDVLWFYLIVWSEPHKEVDDATMLNERYFQLPRDWSNEFSPTFKKNGINRRNTGGLADDLAHIYAQAAHDRDVEWLEKDDPLWLDGDERK